MLHWRNFSEKSPFQAVLTDIFTTGFHGSGITLTKLVGVLVLCFSRTEIFVVFDRCWLRFIHQKDPFCSTAKLFFAGVLFQNVPCFGAAWFLAWACTFACKIFSIFQYVTITIINQNKLDYILNSSKIHICFSYVKPFSY